jgi:hypothetical protein
MKNKKIHIPLIATFMILGLIGGAFRYMHLKTGFDDIGLNVRNNTFSVLLIVLLLAALALLIIVAIRSKKGGALSADKLHLGTIGWKSITFAVIASVFIIAGAAIKFAVSVRPFSLWGFINGLLMFGSGFACVSLIRGISSRHSGRDFDGTITLIPVFMACFALIEYYRDISRNPVPSFYLYNVLSYISLILMIFSCTGYVFSRASLPRVFISLLAYMFFGTVSLVGRSAYLLDELNGKSPQLAELLDNSVIEVLILGYGFFFTAAVLTLFFRPKRAALEE